MKTGRRMFSRFSYSINVISGPFFQDKKSIRRTCFSSVEKNQYNMFR